MNILKYILVYVIALVSISCGTKTNDKAPQPDSSQLPDASVAVKFINDYVSFISKSGFEEGAVTWVRGKERVTEDFKNALRKLIEEAYREDPEMGLDFDPILNAQDYPEGAFVLSTSDPDGYVTVQGKDQPEFKVVVKLKLIGNKWMVDGAGAINIPEEKQPNR